LSIKIAQNEFPHIFFFVLPDPSCRADLRLYHKSVLPVIAVYSGFYRQKVTMQSNKFGYSCLPSNANMALCIRPPSVIGGDVTYLVGYFIGSGQAPCYVDGFWCSADINGDCLIIGGDVTALVSYFIGGGSISYCPDYEPAWPSLPPEAPAG